MIGRSFFEFIHQDDYKEVIKQFRVQTSGVGRPNTGSALGPINPDNVHNMDWTTPEDDDEEEGEHYELVVVRQTLA